SDYAPYVRDERWAQHRTWFVVWGQSARHGEFSKVRAVKVLIRDVLMVPRAVSPTSLVLK
ncbi:MAG: hypothetical protein ACRD1X_10090, partial [Vicinamibacteria bacterium]